MATMFVATPTGARQADVAWEGKFFAVTKLPEGDWVITHKGTGFCMMPADIPQDRRLRLAEVYDAMPVWEGLDFNDIWSRTEEIRKALTAARTEAGL